MPIRIELWFLLAMAMAAVPAAGQPARSKKTSKTKRLVTATTPTPAPAVEVEEEAGSSAGPLERLKAGLVRRGILPRFFQDAKADGALEVIHTNNTRPPRDGINRYRTNDSRHNALVLNQVQVGIEMEPVEESPFGFGLRLSAGTDAEQTKTQTEEHVDNFEVQEAYGSVRFPKGRGIVAKAGRLPVIVGVDGTETLFGLFHPASVTGVRFETPLDDQATISAGVVRGWDVDVEDNNSAPSFETRLVYSPSETVSATVGVITGPEQTANNSDRRTLVDAVLTWKVNDRTDVFTNAAYITEQGAGVNGSGGDAAGLAVGVRRAINDRLALTGRLEVVDDKDGARTDVSQTLRSAAVGAEYQFRKNVTGRVEFRHDASSEDTFVAGERPVSTQNTIGTGVLITF